MIHRTVEQAERRGGVMVGFGLKLFASDNVIISGTVSKATLCNFFTNGFDPHASTSSRRLPYVGTPRPRRWGTARDSGAEMLTSSDPTHPSNWPNVSYRGNVLDQHGKPIDLSFLWGLAVAATITEISTKTAEMGREEPLIPQIELDATMLPNAAACVKGKGYLTINLGILLAVHSLPTTVSFIQDAVDADHKGPHDLEELMAIRPPEQAAVEVSQLLEAWRRSAATGWRQVYFPGFEHAGDLVEDQLLHLIVGHEVGHWLETIYPPDQWADLMSITREHLASWLHTQNEMSDRTKAWTAQRLANNRVQQNWIGEIAADQVGFYRCLSSWHGDWSSELRIWTYVVTGIFFFVLEILELFLCLQGVPNTGETHPPARLRQSIFAHIRSRETKLPLPQFLTTEWGAGLFTATVADLILERAKQLIQVPRNY